MLHRKAYKYKLKTTPELEQKLAQIAGCSRFVWNKALGMNLQRLKDKHGLVWYNELAFWITLWKKTEELSFLKECPSQTLQQTLKRLDRAFRDGFDKNQPNKRLPVFKRKWDANSFLLPQGFKFDNRRVFLPKLGWVGFHKSRDIRGSVKNITVKREGDGWYISVQTEIEVGESLHPTKSIVGVDVGITRLATLSTGKVFRPVNSFREKEKQLAKEKKKLSRKVTGSNNKNKQKRKVGIVHNRAKNSRLDRLHWISSKISKNHAVIILEDLEVKNMSKSASGTVEKPGEKVKAKTNLNKSILDQGWGMLKGMLTYKQKFLGGEVICVNPRYTSQKCPSCNHTHTDNRLTQAGFKCTKCHYENNADLVGAMNILAAGQAVMACESNLSRGRKQEPVGTRKGVLP